MAARVGVDIGVALRDARVAICADDCVRGAVSPNAYRSWGYRSVNVGLGAFPLQQRILGGDAGTNVTRAEHGSTTHHPFTLPAATSTTLRCVLPAAPADAWMPIIRVN